MDAKLNKDMSVFKILKKMFPIAIKAAPILFIVNTILGILHGGGFVLNTFVTQKFFDSVNNIASSDGSIKSIVVIGIILALTLIFLQVVNGAVNFLGDAQMNIILRELLKKINKKAGRIEVVSFENPEFLNDINKAEEGAQGLLQLFTVLVSIFMLYLPYFIFMGIYLYKLKPILALALLMIFLPVALVQIMKVKIFSKLADESAPLRREYDYYEKCIVDREYYKETRLLGGFSFFKSLYSKSLKELNKKSWKAQKKSGIMELAMKCITLSGYIGVLYLFVDALIKGDISVGAFGAIFASIGLMFSLMEEVICMHIGNAVETLGSVRNLMNFLEIEESSGEDITIEGTPEIVLEHLEFTYPGAEKKSISNLEFKINKGETIAIVGENGAGKTTLVKLIMGLYKPTEGKVLINGVDTRKLSNASIYKNTSAVFQKYQRYKMTLKENVVISSINLKDIGKNKIDGDIKKAIKEADLEITKDKFPKDLDTMLSREFDGIDLSGGQWQRIAIARGFYKKHNMIVLDEPTAAIDPVEETKIYEKFSEMSKGNTSIIVTHRLGSAKIADRIVVMDKGNIVEVGTHAELMEKKGQYYDMYEAQSKWYVTEEQMVLG
ncbi:ATP-binding cassette, subfamily B [Clostridium collagenovorans DSM 3089]|uniref:ATP-binding cassette, subfamily B n=1 Tax=Clostridium collagenovorans DSM 3089 TaxID=1121306 RepID=A0A1M5VZV1_9CLOT|nr:ABC transporter ATP-binding protein [Clostridium collagenovorans]SHH80688.1 ATP-binding cassette, subfamily B [Clostridium collagenovorans DSM 3089]